MDGVVLLLLLWLPSVVCNNLEDTVSVTTFNTYLLDVANVKMRKREIIKRLNHLNTDVVCLQEVFNERDMLQVLRETETTFPHSWSFLHNQDGGIPPSNDRGPLCSVGSVLHWVECVCRECVGVQDSVLTLNSCYVGRCNPAVMLTEACRECVVPICSMLPTHLSRLNCILSKVTNSCVTSRGEAPPPTNGLLLLSRRPLHERTRGSLFKTPSLLPRGYLAAKVDGVGDVVCSHFAANLFGGVFMDMATGFSSYQEQNLNNMETVINKFRLSKNLVLLGDLNTGPSLIDRRLAPELEKSYDWMVQQGYVSAGVEKELSCTFCYNNPLTYHPGANYGKLIDHVVLPASQKDRLVSAEIVMRCAMLDQDMKKKKSMRGCVHLSDHYGVTAVLKPVANNP